VTPGQVKKILIEQGVDYVNMRPSELLEAMADVGILQHDGGLASAAERDHNEVLSLFDEYSQLEDWE
jgi:hypothetical protein